MLVNIHKVDLFINQDRKADILMCLVKIDNIPRVWKVIKGGDGVDELEQFPDRSRDRWNLSDNRRLGAVIRVTKLYDNLPGLGLLN